MKLMKISVAFMAMICGLLLVTYIADAVNGAKFYEHPLFIAVIMAFFAVQLICVLKQGFSFQKIGFQITHVGVLLLIVGAILSFLFAKSVDFNIPVDPSSAYSEVQMEDGTVTDFGFEISVCDFDLDLYEDTGEAKQYSAKLVIYDEGIIEKQISINHPVKHNGWKFYLMGYDSQSASYVSMHAKNDIGGFPLLFGFIFVSVGTSVMCFSALNSNKKEVAD